MCLFIRNNKKSAQLWEATTDIKVYKILKVNPIGVLYSPFRNYKYEIGELHKADIILDEFYTDYNFDKKAVIGIISEGLHCFKRKKEALIFLNFSSDYDFLFECIIPKGSLFWYDNIEQEIASNQLIVKKIINDKL